MSVVCGDPAPCFHARSDKNARYSIDTAAGHNLVLTFVSSGREHAEMLETLAASSLFNDEHSALFIVTQDRGDEVEGMLPLRIPGVRAFYDDDGHIAELYGLARFNTRPVTFVVSPRMQVVGLIVASAEDHASQVLGLIERLPSVADLPAVLAHPPIMIIPHVFEPDLCKALIRGYRKNGGKASGFMRDVDGKTVEIQTGTIRHGATGISKRKKKNLH